ncbi:MAG: carboxypeptidase regulatory-like domain-containing protein [Acidobacteria bacterium]|nr:carboxypeptidase regulatory-like domain-containing protein [Acidobacteriota bacterium]
MRVILIAATSLFLAMGAALPQSGQGAITGTITDSAGALMPGVRIEARNTITGAMYQAASGSTGTYTIGQLPAGTYQISVSIPGFKQYTRTGITVVEAQVIRIDIAMTMLSPDEILTNDSVIQLLKAGINEDLIISKIRESQHSFDLSVQGMVALKEGGASDRLMNFLMDPTKPPEAKADPAVPVAAVAPVEIKEPPKEPEKELPREPSKAADTPAAKPEPALPAEAGVYVKAREKWQEIQPEVVVWQTGGMLKRFATAGIVQGDVNGRIKGAHSSKVLEIPLEFLIVSPEGVDITEYQLIHLREQRDAREFRTVTGGIFSSSGGATRDAIAFDSTKIAGRTFAVNLSNLDTGEYGFLPTSAAAAGSSGNVGKMYTFRVK